MIIPSSSCAQELATAFFDNPQSTLDTQCIQKMRALKFELTTNK